MLLEMERYKPSSLPAALVPGGLALTLAQDFREARAWFAQHKRDPFLWLVIWTADACYNHTLVGRLGVPNLGCHTSY